MTYYITFCAFYNGNIHYKYFLDPFYPLYRVLHLPYTEGFISFPIKYRNPEKNVPFYSVGQMDAR